MCLTVCEEKHNFLFYRFVNECYIMVGMDANNGRFVRYDFLSTLINTQRAEITFSQCRCHLVDSVDFYFSYSRIRDKIEAFGSILSRTASVYCVAALKLSLSLIIHVNRKRKKHSPYSHSN